MKNSSDSLQVYDFLSSPNKPAKFLKEVNLPGQGSVEVQTGDYADNIFLIKYTSFIDPSSFLSLNLQSLETSVFFVNKDMQKQTGYNPSDYTSDYVIYKSKKDG
tara:strand:- start:700 stop:1011 length:312 start_codon:yes stop_codon:yes gene_type:complete